MQSRSLLCAAAALLCVMTADERRTNAVDDFKGKTIRILAGSQAGSMYDNFARLMARHLGEHLPGKPTIIVADMPGASGVRATNYLHEVDKVKTIIAPPNEGGKSAPAR